MKIYLDYAATSPLLPCARAAMEACPTANPSSAHSEGMAARRALESARTVIARKINCKPSEIYFTSGATEACNIALCSMFWTKRKRAVDSLKSSPYEHSAVYETAKLFEPQTDNNDEIHILANNETGEIYDVANMAQELRKKGGKYLFFSDATAAVGQIAVDFTALDIDYMAFAAHKFGGPKGIGCLIAKDGAPIVPLIVGGGQERGQRGGTESVELAVGMAAALEHSVQCMPSEQKQKIKLRDYMIERLTAPDGVCKAKLNGAWRSGSCKERLPGNVNLAFPGVSGEALAMCLSEEGIYVSTGAACSSGKHSASRVLLASGVSETDAGSSIRITFGAETTKQDIITSCNYIEKIVHRLRTV